MAPGWVYRRGMPFLIAALLLLSPAEPAAAWQHTVTADRMTASWSVVGDSLRVRLHAETPGWVAIGFNGTETLGGTRLFMASVRGEETRLEEHMADPPRHGVIARPDGKPSVNEVVGSESGGTTVEFSIPLDAPGLADPKVSTSTGGSYPWTALRAGRKVWVTLAWSHEDAFDHHSAMRTASWSEL